MNGSNVNNSISHPPHPRRAVPANLPPGAFLFFVIWLALFFWFMVIPTYAQESTVNDLSKKIQELRLKSNAHSKFVNELLAENVVLDPLVTVNDFIEFEAQPVEEISDSAKPVNLPIVQLPEQRVDSPTDNEVIEDDLISNSPSFEKTKDTQSIPSSEDRTTDNSSPPTYEELYEPKVPQRRVGYYFGPFIGPVFPDDGAVRESDGSRIACSSDNGFMGGFRLGNDFGAARIEGEYAFISHGISSHTGTGRTNFHNLSSRLILEKSLGERADFRGGIGLGVGFINNELGGKDYDGVGFTYDFLLGWSYRVMNNWSINLDYRHYLTAAHENYDRLQGHIIEISAGFDL